jgi:hypothetical protein
MGAKTKAVDDGISEFYFNADLTIDPPLPDSKIKGVSNDYIKLKQIKDEDVQLINGEIVVVSNNVTGVLQEQGADDYTYNYPDFKKGLVALAKVARDAGSVLKGQVLVKDANNGSFLRLKVDGNTFTAEAAALGWPDGTQTPFPENGCA